MQNNLLISIHRSKEITLPDLFLRRMRHEDRSGPIKIPLLTLLDLEPRNIRPIVHSENVKPGDIMIDIDRPIPRPTKVQLEHIPRLHIIIDHKFLNGTVYSLGDTLLDVPRGTRCDAYSDVRRGRLGDDISGDSAFHPSDIERRDAVLVTLWELLPEIDNSRQGTYENLVGAPAQPWVTAVAGLANRF